ETRPRLPAVPLRGLGRRSVVDVSDARRDHAAVAGPGPRVRVLCRVPRALPAAPGLAAVAASTRLAGDRLRLRGGRGPPGAGVVRLLHRCQRSRWSRRAHGGDRGARRRARRALQRRHAHRPRARGGPGGATDPHPGRRGERPDVGGVGQRQRHGDHRSARPVVAGRRGAGPVAVAGDAPGVRGAAAVGDRGPPGRRGARAAAPRRTVRDGPPQLV
ncbi:MAG: hypothetical protein AVDCRST_MAG34-1192, partial [uncultured Nocardioidaceae bacterium]